VNEISAEETRKARNKSKTDSAEKPLLILRELRACPETQRRGAVIVPVKVPE
jgi:hypothetical protein